MTMLTHIYTYRLPNNLKAMLVSDPTTEKAAAALSVKVGASSDPKQASGLAHFLEHMVCYVCVYEREWGPSSSTTFPYPIPDPPLDSFS